MSFLGRKRVRTSRKLSRWARFLRVLRKPGILFLTKKRKADLNSSIITAYDMLLSDGLEKTLSYLRRNDFYHSPGTTELFKAIAATNDVAWTENMNAWLKRHSHSVIRLKPGTDARFLRISFEDLPPVVGSQPKISVLMPTHNAETTIRLAVQSILQQTWRNLELIVVNDNSTDSTAKILAGLAQQEPRLKVLNNLVNVGPYVSKNRALAVASGDFITGHDADDLALPDRLERQVRPLLHDHSLVGAYGHMVRLDETGRPNYLSRIANHSFDGILRRAMISLMLRREVFSLVGYWDSVRFGADMEFLARVERAFPNSVVEDRACTMLCLNEKGSLTNNPASGISNRDGPSQIRVEYRDSWKKWHQEHRNEILYRSFSNLTREFEAPEGMVIPQSDILKVQG
ncbi:glycosyltransferase family 2 protein [Ruegeria conchae]|uniref:Glycosyltransferase involved in cell wall biosynthesis n=1 Tax=Ruegeria conchae TaxID=981384 RepID=A0A497ZEY8_9RHOB|nr:glycosyltransferase family A protein [Ruegeria conchae]RLK03556.1 glycosyltransferase involved in cell wall biosynthesis [Ruegeria conchae]